MVTKSASPANSPTYLPVRQDWLDRRKEPILEPELPIVDPHHHLWDRPGWRYLLDELVADTNSGHNIQATVYVQARAMYRARGPVEMLVVVAALVHLTEKGLRRRAGPQLVTIHGVIVVLVP